LELRQLHDSVDQFPDRGRRNFSACARNQQDEGTGTKRACVKGMPGVRNDDSNQSHALPALHNGTGANGHALML
jgi:hypothetical protein